MQILQANANHLKFIIDAQLKMAMETENLRLDPETVRRGVGAVLSDPNKGVYYVAELGNMPIASALVINEWSDWRARNVWWIHSVYVSPDFRDQGAFRNMYNYLQKLVNESQEVAGLRLYVDKSNLRAQAIYKKIGMSNDHYELYEWLKN